MSRREDAWARIGVLLALLQHVERELNMALTALFPDQAITLDQIASLKKSQKKQTLGQLIRALRTRIPKFGDYKTFLSSFVEDRNRFVHSLFTEKGFHIKNPKNVSRIRKFVDSLTHRSITLDIVFHAANDALAGKPPSGPAGSFRWPASLKHKKGDFERHINETMRVG
jgi:hypothetical protein